MSEKFVGCPTTRRYPRTLAEAFPKDPQNFEWFFPPEQRIRDKVFLAVGVIAWVCICWYFWRA